MKRKLILIFIALVLFVLMFILGMRHEKDRSVIDDYLVHIELSGNKDISLDEMNVEEKKILKDHKDKVIQELGKIKDLTYRGEYHPQSLSITTSKKNIRLVKKIKYVEYVAKKIPLGKLH